MESSEIPLFAMLRSRLGYLTERQKVIAENVANADTAGFTPKDLKAFDFQAQMQAASSGGVVQAVTQPGHMVSARATSASAAGVKAVKTPDSEKTLNGNSVVLEDEMIKMNQARVDYEAAIGFYQKSLNLIRLAAKAPGK